MPNPPTTPDRATVFRVDSFIVPREALPPFNDQLKRVHAWLGALPGCQQNLVLLGTDDADACKVVTFVEWANAEAVAAAKASMQQKYAQEGFDPAAFMQKLGIQARMGAYRATLS
jgi:heme-degrading monooxygenase HmoA